MNDTLLKPVLSYRLGWEAEFIYHLAINMTYVINELTLNDEASFHTDRINGLSFTKSCTKSAHRCVNVNENQNEIK